MRGSGAGMGSTGLPREQAFGWAMEQLGAASVMVGLV